MLDQKLRKLRLGHAASVLEAHHQAAINAKLGYLEFLEAIVDDELETREHKGLDKRLRAARFPVTKTLEDFDFAFQPSLDAMLVKALVSCDFIGKHETVLVYRTSGRGEEPGIIVGALLDPPGPGSGSIADARSEPRSMGPMMGKSLRIAQAVASTM